MADQKLDPQDRPDLQDRLDPQVRIDRARALVAAEAARARRRLWAQRLTRALWPLWTLAAAFLGAAFLGLPQSLPYGLHVALLAGLAAASLWLARDAWRVWRTPTEADARALLDADLRDAPVAALDDALSAGATDPAAQALWRAHRARMADRAMAARAPALDLRVSDRDRFALRHAAGIALAAGLIAQIADGGARLTEALTPVGAATAAAALAPAPSLEAWASPPLYTRAAPLYLTERLNAAEPIRLPVGSEITLRVFDAPASPRLTAEGVAEAPAFTDEGGGAWGAILTLRDSGRLEVAADGAPFGFWRFEAIPDAAPTIAFTEQPGAAPDGSLRFAFQTADDHGVVAARAEVTLDVAAAGPRGIAADTVFEPVVFELPLPLRGAAEAAAETVSESLTENPWVGLPVIVTLIAEDAAGQTAQALARIALPGRRFRDPLARALIEQRRELAWSVGAAPRVRDVIDAITAHPDDAFEDASAYLIVRTARRRLGYAIEGAHLREEIPGVAELLWQAALKIEDGDLSDAEKRLRELQQELSEALERGASDEEIAALMDELREALQDFLQQLAQEAMRNQAENGQRQPQQPMDPNQMMSQQDLMDMLDRLEEAMRNGMQDMARQMLQDLQQMLENLQMAEPGQQGQQGEGDQAMQQLQDMIGQQQGLADRSFDALREGREGQQGQQPGQQGQQGRQGQGQRGQQPGQGRQGQGQQGQPGQGQQGQGQPGQGQQGQGQGQPGGPDLGAIARDQEGLRRLLDDLRRGMPGGGGGEALDRAERSMGEARDALRDGDAEGALQDQVDALDALREGAQELAQQMQNQPGQSQQAGREGRSGDVRDEDPFGRPTATDGPLDGDSVRVPDASVAKRARELMDEIRRRAGERTRPEGELDYLRRLLERF